MQLLRQIWQDIRQGENIDLYITVIISIFVATLNVAGIASQSWIAPLNLGILALITFALLGNRHRLEAIFQRMTAAEELFLTEFPDDLRNNLEKSRELLIIGTSLSRTLHLYYSLFEDKLRKGDIIKVLLMSPDSSACEAAAMRSYQPMDVETQRTYIRTSLNALRNLQIKTSGELEIRVLNNSLSYGAIILDLETPNGVMYLWNRPFKTRIRSIPKIVLRPANGIWYEFYKDEAMSMWNNAVSWQVQDGTAVRD
jgi:hypothetical protein